MEIIIAIALLAGGSFAGYRIWIRPREAGLSLEGRALLGLVLLSLLGGLFGAPAWWIDNESAFSWDLPPLASRMLGAAGLSYVVAALLVLTRPSDARLRLHVLLLFVYLAPLVVAILLFHLDRFDFGRAITYGFFVIAGGMTVVGTYFLLRPPSLDLAPADPLLPTPVVRGWLLAVAAVTLVWGAALFATDDGGSNLVWAWRGDLLSSRLIGVMVLTIGVARSGACARATPRP